MSEYWYKKEQVEEIGKLIYSETRTYSKPCVYSRELHAFMNDAGVVTVCDGIPYWDESCTDTDERCSYGVHFKEKVEDIKHAISARKRVSMGHGKGKIPDHIWDKEVFHRKNGRKQRG